VSGKKGDEPDRPPWHAPGVTGVEPPGRRLAKPTETKGQPWNASGVRGVTPPGKLKPGEGPAVEWLARKEKKTAPAGGGGKKTPGEAPPAGRPTAGFVPDVFSDQGDPKTLRDFLDEIAKYFREHAPDESATVHLAELIGQSHAPYELVVAFTLLSALVGTDTEQRNRYAWALERGAKAFYNLAMRLDKKVKPPRGLAPQRLDPLFYDLPASAYQIPYAYATDAFLRMLELVRGDIAHDRAMITFARGMHQRFVASRSFGDKALSHMFPWEDPIWAPED
jgi:hypothetical protein